MLQKLNLLGSNRELGRPRWSSGAEFACNAEDTGDEGLIPGSGRFPGDRKWQPTPVFSLEKSDGQKSLEGYSPKGRKESDTLKPLSTHALYINIIKGRMILDF